MTGGQTDNGSTDADGHEPEPVPTPAAGETATMTVGQDAERTSSADCREALPDPWRVHLSGGGVRATLCSAGALWQFRRMHDTSSISEIISVSGGSLTSVALLRDQPTVGEMNGFVSNIHRRTKMNISNAASVVALAGTIGVLAGAAFAKPALLSDGWTAWVFVISLAVWLIAIAIVRVVIAGSLVLVGALLTIEFDVAPRIEGQVAGGAIVVVGLVLLAIAARRWWLAWTPDAPRRARPPRTWLQRTGVTLTWIALVAIPLALTRWPIGQLVSSILAVVTAGVVSLVLGPLLLRGYLGRLVGDAYAKEKLGEAQQRGKVSSWCASHVVCTTSLRDEVPAFFVIDVANAEGDRVMQPVIVADEVHDQAPLFAMDAGRVRIVTMLQASAAAFPQFAPTVGFGTRTKARTKTPTVRMPAFPLFADGGLRGTLGTQFTHRIENELDQLSDGGRPRVAYERTLVVDATRRRAPLFWWPVMLVPKFGSSLIQLRLVQAMLSALVDAERERLAENDPPAGGVDAQTARRPERRVVVVRATGARFTDSPTSGGDPTRFDDLMTSLRTTIDRQTGWFPGSRKAAHCIAGGALAMIDAEVPSSEKWDEAMKALADLEIALGTKLRLDQVAFTVPDPMSLMDRLRRRWSMTVAVVARLTRWARGQGSETGSDSSDSTGVRPATSAGRTRGRRARDIGRLVTTGCVASLVIASAAVNETRLMGNCEPVCADGGRHPALGSSGFVAVSHQGVGGASNVITTEGFVNAYTMGYRHFETDIGLAPDGRLVAIHKNDRPDAEESASSPVIADLLDDPRLAGGVWHLEINTDDHDVVTALGATIATASATSRVCVHFGDMIDPQRVQRVRSALDDDTCVCASVLERLRTADLPLNRLVLQAVAEAYDRFRELEGVPARVDCSVVFQGTAEARDVADAGKNVVVLAWANGEGNETEEQLTALVDAGFGGMITNDHELLKQVLMDAGKWPTPSVVVADG